MYQVPVPGCPHYHCKIYFFYDCHLCSAAEVNTKQHFFIYFFYTTGTPELKEVANQLSVADIKDFLKTVAKLEQYASLFEENEIDGTTLFRCTNKSLEDLGIANDFHRTKILAKFEKHLQEKIGK